MLVDACKDLLQSQINEVQKMVGEMHRDITNCDATMARVIINIHHSILPYVKTSYKFKGEHSAKEVEFSSTRWSSIYS